MTEQDVERGPEPTEPVPAPYGAATDLLTVPFAGAPIFTRARALRPTGKVLPEHARSHNRALVLQTLYTAGAQSRADVARETGLTRVTISDLVADLIAEGLVIELGQREHARPGKPAILIDVDRAAFHIIGVDLSEHQRFLGAVIDLDGDIVSRAEVDRAGATGEHAIDLVIELVRTLLGSTTTPVLGIGVGSPGVVDPLGVVRSAPNIGWTDVALQARLADEFSLPVHVANDANVAVLAEHGASQLDDLLLVKIGHGVGAGLIIGGRPVIGSGFAAGEIGHVVVGTDGGPRCACGKHGCLEVWLAVPRLTARLDAIDPDSPDAASARDEILHEAGRRLGIVLAPVVGALNLAEVVLSGPAELLDGALHEATVDTLRNRTMAEHSRDLRLRMTAQAQDIVLRGAAVMVLSGQLGVA
ncbi:ROK family transcriptional regulator [Agromyces sp. ISL-38]|uniref:ROK family transcriptional regulator n=1 Tax=Agromyces sp. ISL-38 TaxID=2819107 RepID=UPI001BE7915F|nr:ROK family transcriptional regulator [Agromyces sp. ISL-38]MBT2498228.1 ROK family transcriptional regulator [Agromyces sp. ISL-38]